jgi:hypothetical protein
MADRPDAPQRHVITICEPKSDQSAR